MRGILETVGSETRGGETISLNPNRGKDKFDNGDMKCITNLSEKVLRLSKCKQYEMRDL